MFQFGFDRAYGGSPRGVLGAVIGIYLALLAPLMLAALAHEGHDHGPSESVTGPLAPRVSARSDTYELVGILRGERLVIYLDRFASNEPVTTADITVTIGDATEAVNAERAAEGTYALTSPRFKTAGQIELVFSITGETGEDLLAGMLKVPQEAAAATPGASTIGTLRTWLRSLVAPIWQIVLLAAATAGLALSGGYFLLRRRFVQAAAMALMAVAGVGLLFETARGHGGERPAAASKSASGGRFAAPAAGRTCLRPEADAAAARRAHRAIVAAIGAARGQPDRTRHRGPQQHEPRAKHQRRPRHGARRRAAAHRAGGEERRPAGAHRADAAASRSHDDPGEARRGRATDLGRGSAAAPHPYPRGKAGGAAKPAHRRRGRARRAASAERRCCSKSASNRKRCARRRQASSQRRAWCRGKWCRRRMCCSRSSIRQACGSKRWSMARSILPRSAMRPRRRLAGRR